MILVISTAVCDPCNVLNTKCYLLLDKKEGAIKILQLNSAESFGTDDLQSPWNLALPPIYS